MTVRLEPTTFTLVHFDADELVGIAEEVLSRLGVSDESLEIVVDEKSSLGAVRLTSIAPIRGSIESGAIEDPQHVRALSAERAAEAIGRLVLEALDRRREGFDAPPLEEDVPLGPRVAWDISLVGRLARAGGMSRRQRRRYQFRVRHGFSDRADEVFDRLWSATDDLTYAELVAASARAADETPAAG